MIRFGFDTNGMPIKDIKQFVEMSMVGKETNPRRIEMRKQQEKKIQQQIREFEENLIRIQEKILRLERGKH